MITDLLDYAKFDFLNIAITLSKSPINKIIAESL